VRVLVIGATGVIGSAVAEAFDGAGHEVVRASRKGENRVDITDCASIRALFEKLGTVDAVVSCAGAAIFKPVGELTDGDVEEATRLKVSANIDVVRLGVDRVSDGGQFILTTGIFSTRPIAGVPLIAMVNGALESFVRAAALDLPRDIRINAVCPLFINETAEQMGMKGDCSAAENAKVYLELATGSESGSIVTPGL